MTPEQTKELQTLREESYHGCKFGYKYWPGMTNRCTHIYRGDTEVCTILTDGQCPRPTSPDKWYADKVVAEAARKRWETLEAWDCSGDNPDEEAYPKWVAYTEAENELADTMRSDSERRANKTGGEL